MRERERGERERERVTNKYYHIDAIFLLKQTLQAVRMQNISVSEDEVNFIKIIITSKKSK